MTVRVRVLGIAKNRATRKDVSVAAIRVCGRIGVYLIRSAATGWHLRPSTLRGSLGA